MPNRNINYLKKLESTISPPLWSLLTNLSGLAEAKGTPLYLAGGSVRDILLGTIPVDLDFVVEGNAVELANTLAKRLGGEVTTHSRFGTASYAKKDISIDLVGARTENYPRPGSLPVVKPGTIAEDLYRRDFTVNAMAVRISGPQSGQILDPFDGLAGIKNKQIKVLHNQSFSDDPTRIIRAIRYEQRFGFRIDIDTNKLIQSNLQKLPSVGVDRLRKELDLLFSEEKPEAAINRAFELGVLQEIHPSLTAGGWLLKKFKAARCSRMEVDPSVYLSILLYRMAVSQIDQFLSHYRFRKSQVEVVNDTIKLKGFEAQLSDPMLKPSTALRILKGIGLKAILAFSIVSEDEIAKNWAQKYLEKLRLINTELTGIDLVNMRVPSGPRIGQILAILLDARVDGIVRSRDDELRLVKNVISEHNLD